MEPIQIKSTGDYPTPTGPEVISFIPVDKDGVPIIADVQYPTPTEVVTVHYDGPDTIREADEFPPPVVEEKSATIDNADTKVVDTAALK